MRLRFIYHPDGLGGLIYDIIVVRQNRDSLGVFEMDVLKQGELTLIFYRREF